MRAQRSTDSNFVIRAFFVHCFIHIYQMLRAVDPSNPILTQPKYSGPPDFSCSKKSEGSSLKELTRCLKTY